MGGTLDLSPLAGTGGQEEASVEAGPSIQSIPGWVQGDRASGSEYQELESPSSDEELKLKEVLSSRLWDVMIPV